MVGLAALDPPYNCLQPFPQQKLVSGDSDLVPAIRMIKDHFPQKEIVVYIPARTEIRGAAIELRLEAHKQKTLPLDLLSKSQFPSSVVLGGGRTVTKPAAS
jgi:hypothetical protein